MTQVKYGLSAAQRNILCHNSERSNTFKIPTQTRIGSVGPSLIPEFITLFSYSGDMWLVMSKIRTWINDFNLSCNLNVPFQ